MEVTINQPLGFSELGSRSNNEDTLFPDPTVATTQQRWFMVCDGVGGSERGEVASNLAATEFDHFFRQNPAVTITEAYIQKALHYVQDRFDDYVAANPQAESMGTTLTLVYVHDNGITVAHLGDSRVYLIRNGEIIWRTDDHSYVNELVKAGVLSSEEARKHPQRNVITRAIQSSDKRAQADVQLLNDLRPGDYLFMCTDGVLERISDELLEKTLGSDDSNSEKMSTLHVCSYGQTRDNFTAYLIQVATVTGKVASSAKVALPVYERPESDDEDDAVTLIGVPRPESVPSYVTTNQSNEIPPRREPTPQVVENRPVVEPKPAYTPQPVAKSTSPTRWLPWVLVTLLLGAGSLVLWYRYRDVLEKPADKPVAVQAPAKTVESSQPAATSPIAETESQASETSTSDANTSPSETSSDNKSDESKKEPDNKKNKPTKGELKVILKKENLKLEVTSDEEGQRGLRWIGGKEIFEPQFQKIYINDFKWGLIPVDSKGNKKYISQQGRIYDKIGSPSQKCGRISARRDNTWAYLNLNGNEIVKAGQYTEAKAFDEKTCTAEVKDQNGKPFRIDIRGQRQNETAPAQADKPTQSTQ
ncbi:hypothetical protein GCM10028807_60520 [Spirosoma daeguense]